MKNVTKIELKELALKEGGKIPVHLKEFFLEHNLHTSSQQHLGKGKNQTNNMVEINSLRKL